MTIENVAITAGVDVLALYRQVGKESEFHNWLDRVMLTADDVPLRRIAWEWLAEVGDLLSLKGQTDLRLWSYGASTNCLKLPRYVGPPHPFVVLAPCCYFSHVKPEEWATGYGRHGVLSFLDNTSSKQLLGVAELVRLVQDGSPYLMWSYDYEMTRSVRLLHNEGFVT